MTLIKVHKRPAITEVRGQEMFTALLTSDDSSTSIHLTTGARDTINRMIARMKKIIPELEVEGEGFLTPSPADYFYPFYDTKTERVSGMPKTNFAMPFRRNRTGIMADYQGAMKAVKDRDAAAAAETTRKNFLDNTARLGNEWITAKSLDMRDIRGVGTPLSGKKMPDTASRRASILDSSTWYRPVSFKAPAHPAQVAAFENPVAVNPMVKDLRSMLDTVSNPEFLKKYVEVNGRASVERVIRAFKGFADRYDVVGKVLQDELDREAKRVKEKEERQARIAARQELRRKAVTQAQSERAEFERLARTFGKMVPLVQINTRADQIFAELKDEAKL